MPSPDSVLFVTLDSCRYDSLAAAAAPALRAIAPLRPAHAPGYFTYASHAAMFVGFTPVATHEPVAFLNPKYAKLFKLAGGGHPGHGDAGFVLAGPDIVRGFAALGHVTIGSGAVGWFDPGTPAGQHLSRPFQHFLFAGEPGSAERQIDWMQQRLDAAGGDVFAFLNLGETHVPYWHDGADWDPADNPCVPFQQVDRADECRRRQRACIEHVDALLAPLLARFAGATILVCADHGDAWGEDGVWEHGIPHETVFTVPLLMRVRGRPI